MWVTWDGTERKTNVWGMWVSVWGRKRESEMGEKERIEWKNEFRFIYVDCVHCFGCYSITNVLWRSVFGIHSFQSCRLNGWSVGRSSQWGRRVCEFGQVCHAFALAFIHSFSYNLNKFDFAVSVVSPPSSTPILIHSPARLALQTLYVCDRGIANLYKCVLTCVVSGHH